MRLAITVFGIELLTLTIGSNEPVVEEDDGEVVQLGYGFTE